QSSGCPDFGQHGWAGAADTGTIAAQAKEAESNTEIRSRIEIDLSPLFITCASCRIDLQGARQMPNSKLLKIEAQGMDEPDQLGPACVRWPTFPHPSSSRLLAEPTTVPILGAILIVDDDLGLVVRLGSMLSFLFF